LQSLPAPRVQIPQVEFRVDGNALQGPLPFEYEAWTQLTTFSVATGSIYCTSIYQTTLTERTCGLTGSLPPGYSAWTYVLFNSESDRIFLIKVFETFF